MFSLLLCPDLVDKASLHLVNKIDGWSITPQEAEACQLAEGQNYLTQSVKASIRDLLLYSQDDNP